jgi:predicted regulator of Ras-like GTPase activity (Roadblock/LC7/MglB family)
MNSDESPEISFSQPTPSQSPSISIENEPIENKLGEIPQKPNSQPKIVEQPHTWTPISPAPQPTLEEIPKSESINAVETKVKGDSPILQQIPAQPYAPQVIPQTPSIQEDLIKSTKRKEEEELSSAMSNAMQTLAKQIANHTPTRRTSQVKEEPQEKMEIKEISPSSLNEILLNLSRLDQNIEATAIINTDGAILASALSQRVSDSLFSTIGRTLTTIGRDIINALDNGDLKSITINGSKGKFSLAPIMKDTLLLILSRARAKTGIIHIAAAQAKKQFKSYLGII